MDKTLYLFPHLPKTGGAALFQNVERFLPFSKCLRLNYTMRQFYTDPRTQKLGFYESEDDFHHLLRSLSPLEKRRLAFMSGHDLFYGLHKTFPQPAKYFMFVREPVARTISLYNYQATQHEFLKNMKNRDESHRRLALFSQRWFLIEGKIPSFEEWLEKSYDGDYLFYFTMTRTLQKLGYLDRNLRNSSWDRLMEKFFFIGLTETMNEDELYLYHEMGIYRFWARRNESYPYVSFKGLDRKIQEKIREKNQDDFILYRHAKEANASFKRERKNFPRVVRYMKICKTNYFFIEKGIFILKFLSRPVLKPIRDKLRCFYSFLINVNG